MWLIVTAASVLISGSGWLLTQMLALGSPVPSRSSAEEKELRDADRPCSAVSLAISTSSPVSFSCFYGGGGGFRGFEVRS